MELKAGLATFGNLPTVQPKRSRSGDDGLAE